MHVCIYKVDLGQGVGFQKYTTGKNIPNILVKPLLIVFIRLFYCYF